MRRFLREESPQWSYRKAANTYLSVRTLSLLHKSVMVCYFKARLLPYLFTLPLTKTDEHPSGSDIFNLFLVLLSVLRLSRQVSPLRPCTFFLN